MCFVLFCLSGQFCIFYKEFLVLTSEEFKKFSKTNSLRAIWDITLCWVLIVGSLYLCHISLFFLPVTMIIIASRMNALIVMMHEGAHFHINENEFINDTLSNLFCSFPLLISTEAYRKTHLKHHQFTQTVQDPNFVIMRREEAWRFPKPKSEVKKILWKDLMVMTLKEHMIILKDWQVIPNYKQITKLERVLFPLFIVVVLAVTAVYGLWVYFFILQVSSLLVNPISRMRAMSEHLHVEAKDQGKLQKLHETPTINANLIERFFISPFNINRHLEHHTYPTIPYYNLEKAHGVIKQTQMYKEHCRYELDGYFIGKRT